MNEPRKPYKDRSRYLTISPRVARIVSVVALGGLCLSFLLGFKTDDGADHGVTALGLVAVMSAVAGYGCAIFLVFCSYSFIADASPDDIDERELQERIRGIRLGLPLRCTDAAGRLYRQRCHRQGLRGPGSHRGNRRELPASGADLLAHLAGDDPRLARPGRRAPRLIRLA